LDRGRVFKKIFESEVEGRREKNRKMKSEMFGRF
jgi:hypothetical protein